jgi:predicted DNA-binding antitoxin AbrB/MazE fold protein
MTQKIRAIFENGVFRPIESVELLNGSQVQLTVQTNEASISAERSLHDADAELDRIAALPIEGDRSPFSGAAHDAVLYGKNGAR